MSEAAFCDSLIAEFQALIERVGADRIETVRGLGYRLAALPGEENA